MALRFVSVMAVLLLLGACETASEQSGAGSTSGGSASTSSPATPESATTSSQTLPGPKMGSAEDFVVNVGDRVFFAFDKYNLSAKARETLQRQATWLKKYPEVTVTIEGHCDERGTREYNLALGERRATAAKNYLIALGINPNRIKTISYGKERPAVAGSNEAAWAQNRRAVTVVNVPGT